MRKNNQDGPKSHQAVQTEIVAAEAGLEQGQGTSRVAAHACVMAPPTEVGSAEAMLAKISTDVPLPSFSSVIVSATLQHGKDDSIAPQPESYQTTS